MGWCNDIPMLDMGLWTPDAAVCMAPDCTDTVVMGAEGCAPRKTEFETKGVDNPVAAMEVDCPNDAVSFAVDIMGISDSMVDNGIDD